MQKKANKNLARIIFILVLIIFSIFIARQFWASISSFVYQNLAKLSLLNSSKSPVEGMIDEKVAGELFLIIDKISIKAPINLNVDGSNETKYFKVLEKGVAHLQNTAKPGEKGNVVIFGHSSQNIGVTGKYGEIFIKLNDLEKGDEIKIFNNLARQEYSYKVSSKKIVQPEEVSVTDPTKFDQLTLITCWPIGSDQKRLVIFAKPK